MYDYYFGSIEDIKKDEEKFLLGVKRMLPKWCNSIPDSEYIALYRLCDKKLNELQHKPVLVETGIGSSTIVLTYLAIKYGGTLYTWDICGEKGSQIRIALVETIGKSLNVDIHRYWKFIGFSSTALYLGLKILEELEKHVDVFYHDSQHTWRNISNELNLIHNMFIDGSIICLDDSNYNFLDVDFRYININRKKLGLKDIDSPTWNLTEEYYKLIEKYLKTKWREVKNLGDEYRKICSEDIYFTYFDTENIVRQGIKDNILYRFNAWEVSGRYENSSGNSGKDEF